MRPDRTQEWNCVEHQDKRRANPWIVAGNVAIHQFPVLDALFDPLVVAVVAHRIPLQNLLPSHPHSGKIFCGEGVSRMKKVHDKAAKVAAELMAAIIQVNGCGKSMQDIDEVSKLYLRLESNIAEGFERLPKCY